MRGGNIELSRTCMLFEQPIVRRSEMGNSVCRHVTFKVSRSVDQQFHHELLQLPRPAPTENSFTYAVTQVSFSFFFVLLLAWAAHSRLWLFKNGVFLTFTAHFISFKFESCSAVAVKTSCSVVTNVFTSCIIQATLVEI